MSRFFRTKARRRIENFRLLRISIYDDWNNNCWIFRSRRTTNRGNAMWVPFGVMFDRGYWRLWSMTPWQFLSSSTTCWCLGRYKPPSLQRAITRGCGGRIMKSIATRRALCNAIRRISFRDTERGPPPLPPRRRPGKRTGTEGAAETDRERERRVYHRHNRQVSRISPRRRQSLL